MNVTEPSHAQVSVESSDLTHILRFTVFNDGTGAVLCGRKPFPEKWVQVVHAGRKCPTCVDKWKAGR